MRAAFIIAGKDLRQRLRDRSAILIAFVVPLGLAFILNATIAGVADMDFTVTYAVADQDTGPVSDALGHVLGAVQESGFADLVTASGEQAAQRLVDDGQVDAAFVIPSGFSDAVSSGSGATIEVLANPDSGIAVSVARSIAQGFAEDVNAVSLSVTTAVAAGAPGDPGSIATLAERAAQRAAPLALVDRATEEGGVDFTTFYAIGISVFFVFFTVQFGILSLIDERQDGTLPRLLAAPIPSAAIILGKVLASFVLGVVSMVVLVAGTTLLMGAEWGDPIGVLILVCAGVLAAMGITALIATVAKTAEQAGSIASLVAVILGLLGGTFFPVSQASGIITTLTWITPHAWLMRGFTDLAAGDGPGDVLLPVFAVVVFAAVTGAIGLALSRRLVRVA
jgi:ABC-2 type transport system permease protein